MKIFRNPESIHKPLGGYHHQIEVRSERLLFIAGQVGMRPDGSLPADPHEQLDLALHNVILNLEAAGMQISDLTKVTFYLVGDFDTARRRAQVAERLGGHQPCMTLLTVARLATPELLVEIDAFATAAPADHTRGEGGGL